MQFQLKKKNKQRKVAKSEEKNELDVGKTLSYNGLRQMGWIIFQ